MQLRLPPWTLKWLSFTLILALFSTFVPAPQLAEALSAVKESREGFDLGRPGGGLEEIRQVDPIETRYGLVAILVEEEIWNATATNSLGLFNFLGSSRLSEKIETYAADVQSTLPYTKSMIITVSPDDTVPEIQRMLERFYFEGNPDDSDFTQLTGVVMVGDVPLPVVNKNENRFISLLPYTDFEDPSYLLDAATQDFLPNQESEHLQPEAWHGLIVPPVDGEVGLDMLADFFDKNHAFHSGDEEYTTFDERVFIGDLVTEESTLNKVSFDSYQRYLNLWEEITYYQYSNDLVEELFREMAASIEPGDGIDNDDDGLTDEEALNSIDDDGDGLIDEDLGDGFYGIDNDGDGQIDEDNFEDNNNDADWAHDVFRVTNFNADRDDSDLFHDTQIDEDPPGDANGDGCPGTCGQEGLLMGDSDTDGYVDAWEIANGYDLYDERRPFTRVSRYVNREYGTNFDISDEGDTEASEYLKLELIDSLYGSSINVTCKDENGVAHPEWDDDFDFFCDEDGSTEDMIWGNQWGTQAPSGCAYNDADCDGQIDEDPLGIRPENNFENIPDIQAKGIIEGLTNRYAEIFDQPQGVWNRLVAQTGRWDTGLTGEDSVNNEYDSSVSLIAKKDEAVLQYLGQVNAYFEAELDEIVEDRLQEDIPMIAAVQITGEYRREAQSEDDEPEWEDICNEGPDPNLTSDACLQFVNHSTDTPGRGFTEYGSNLETNNFHIYGQLMWEVDEVRECTIFAGTNEDDGQFTQFNSLYSTEQAALNDTEVKELNNCVPEFRDYTDDIPELCDEPTVTESIRALDGALRVDIDENGDPVDTSQWETNFGACFEFREMTTFEDYVDANEDFNDWLSGKIRRFRRNDDGRDDTYEEFIDRVDRKRDSYDSPKPGTATLRKNYRELDMLAADENRTYTVEQLFRDLGFTDLDNDALDIFIATQENGEAVTVSNPQYGTAMGSVERVRIFFDKLYLKEDSTNNRATRGEFTADVSEAYHFSSVNKHVDPTPEVLNAQIQNAGTPDLPIDATRRISFMDSENAAQELNYVNVFDAESFEDVEAQLSTLASAMEEVAGGTAFSNDVLDFIEGINEDELMDALEWYHMNIDEKHRQVFTHYLGEQEPIWSKARNGYEAVAIVADGTPTELFFGFNGGAPKLGDEEDLEFQYRSIELAEEALAIEAAEAEEEQYAALTPASNTTPVVLSEWIAAMQAWLQDTKDTFSSFDTYGDSLACGSPLDFTSSATEGVHQDDDSDGIPNGAENTVSLSISSEDYNVLEAGGNDYYTVSLMTLNSAGQVNTEDHFTEVELRILAGSDSVEIQGSSQMQVNGGVATFVLKSTDEPGAFIVQGRTRNLGATLTSGTLSGSVVEKVLVVDSFDGSEASDEVLADGQSSLTLRAEIRNGDGRLDTNDNSSLVEFILSTEAHGEIETKQARAVNGVAETSFLSSVTAGQVDIEARLVDGSLPSRLSRVQVHAGEPNQLVLEADSRVLPVGGESINNMRVNLFDAFGNWANNGFYTVTLNTEGSIEILDLFDEDPEMEGIQVNTPDGYLDFRVLASTVAENAAVSVSMADNPSLSDRFVIQHIEGMELDIQLSRAFMLAGGNLGQDVLVRMVDSQGRTLNGFQGEIFLSLSDNAYGSFNEDRVQLENGQAQVRLFPGTLAGIGSLVAESPGVQSGSTSFTVRSADPYELRVRKADNSLEVKAGELERFIVEVYDEYGNLVTSDSSTPVDLRITDATQDYGRLTRPSVTLNQGAAPFSVQLGEISGTLNLVASNEDLLAGTWSGDINYSLTSEDFENIEPQMLYASLLGAPYGDVTEDNYIGGYMTFNGRTQAVTSLIDEPHPKERLASIDAEGAISLPQDSMVTQSVMGAGSGLPVRIQWRAFPNDDLMAELIYVLPETQEELFSAELLTSRPAFEIEAMGGDNGLGDLVLRENGAGVVRVREDGQILLLDPDYSLSVNGGAEGLGFVVLKTTEQIMRVDFNAAWSSDVSSLEHSFDFENWGNLSSGIYVRPHVSQKDNLVSIPSGNNSLNPNGLALVDPTKTVPKSMQPSLGYRSLESAEEDGGIGWENENKHLLLFAAGNTVGDSNLFYPSEVGVVLGDPTISLTTENDANGLGFTSDIGRMVSTSSEEVMTLLDLDYNGDGQMDVLTVYEDGRIEVLQNARSDRRLHNQGTLLYIENGIDSIDAGDFNDDGLDDLLIVTEESCYAEEMCLYVYENIGGGFVAQNLDLPEIESKPTQVEVADLNNDDYDDLVLVDQDMRLYTVWNAAGSLDTVDFVRDFGLNENPSENLQEDVMLHYHGLPSSSASLSVSTTSFETSETTVTTEVSDFLTTLGSNDSFNVNLNGSDEGGTVSRRTSIGFEYADVAALQVGFDVRKTLDDLNGDKIEVDDELEYTITVTNPTKQFDAETYTNLYISDTIGSSFDFNEDSFSCEDCSGVNAEATLERGDLAHPWVFGPLTLEVDETVTLSYTVTVNDLPNLQLMVGQDFYDDYKDDNFADIAVSLEGNNTGTLMVYYSDGYVTESRGGFELLGNLGATRFRRINYQEQEYSPEAYEEEYDSTVEGPFEDDNEDGVPDFIEDMDPELGVPVPNEGYDPSREIFGAEDVDNDGYYSTEEMFASNDDVDGDGILDIVDNWVSTANLLLEPGLSLQQGEGVQTALQELDASTEQITQVIEDVISTLTCAGGCLNLPGSVAFLAPGNFHDPFTGATLGYDPGTPAFGIIPFLPVACTGPSCIPASIMRVYLAPTTTLGLGMGICAGAYPVGQCFAFNIPVLQLIGVCDAINNFIAEGLSRATAYVSSGGSQLFNAQGSVGITANDSATGIESSIFTSYVPPTSVNSNVQIPGFPSVFTEWWKAQKQEFFKMLDLPDVTLIYPDPKSISTEFTNIGERAQENRDENAIELDQSEKIQELTGGIRGLENFLNIAHAFPLIDIKPQKVNINYPALSPEEIELIQRDWLVWTQDTERKWLEFKAAFNARNDVTDAERRTYNELEDVIEESLTAMNANLSVLESYEEIPEQILRIRELQAYYARIIVCYLDAVLSYTAGYLTENAQRAEAWGQWAVDLEEIVDGWEILIDASVQLMQACDKCTNQRWSGMQLLFSLFVFVPDFPVIQLPKLPDIVVDVSNIQAGVDIIWPDVEFVPQSVNLPQLPSISFPSAYLNGDVNLDVSIPRLQEFPVVFESPELPGLPLPELPSLPPPPAIPEIYPSLKASVNVATNVLRVVCLIRQGFVPISEFALKPKIEEITERPGGVLLPTDLTVTNEWPAFNFDFLKRVEVNTYLNLTADFTLLYDLIENLGDESDDLVTDLLDEFNGGFQGLSNGVQQAVNPIGEASVTIDEDVDFEADLTSYDHPAIDTALAYKDNPMLAGQLTALKQTLETLQGDINTWAAELPESYELEAEQKLLALDDPLLQRYDSIDPELDRQFLAQIEGTPIGSIASMRNSLMAYVDDLEAGTSRMEGMDGPAFQRYLAQEYSGADVLLASDGSDDGFSSADSWQNAVVELSSETLSASSAVSAFESFDIGNPEASNQGLYIYNEEFAIAERLIDYTQEDDEGVNVLFIDIDGDDDEDIVYSLGGDIYLKTNSNNEASLTYVNSDPVQGSVDDWAPTHGSVHNLKTGRNDYQEASFSFNAAPVASGYEVLLYDSMDAQESEPEENIKRLLLLERDRNEAEAVSDSEDRSFSTRESRLVVDSVNGRAVLKNAAKRTRIRANGELETADNVVFQTLEDTLIKVTVEGETGNLNLPAYTWVEFGRAQDRTIRVENGSVLWIQSSEMLAEQSLLEGMEIFAEEQIELLSSRAEVVLQSSEGARFSLDNEELFVMDRLSNATSPSSKVQLENGAYYSVMRSVHEDGGFGTLSDNILLNPQVCADDSAPYPIISENEVDLAIFSTTELSAESSFDSDSSIVDAYWDLDASEDADGDGVRNNDEQVIGLTAEIGPYDDIDQKEVTLWVTDASGNQASATTLVNIYVPELTITDASTEAVEGTTTPESPLFPFHLVREREGSVSELGDGYLTDELGDFLVDNFESSDLLSVYNASDELIAQFNPESKQLLAFHSAYDVELLASDGEWPSRLVVYEKATGTILASFIIVTDSVRDILQVDDDLEDYNLIGEESILVYVDDNEEAYNFEEDGLRVTDDYDASKLHLSRNGNIRLVEEDYAIEKRAAETLEDPLMIEIYQLVADKVRPRFEAELWPGSPENTSIVSTDELGLPASVRVDAGGVSSTASFNFADISEDDPLYNDMIELIERGVLEGYLEEGERLFKPNQRITRAEFTKIMLSILCIVPSEPAYELPFVFNDIRSTEPWYYPYTKESFLRELIVGYQGETDANGLTPYKPRNDISRAEAAKIILEALDKEGIIALPDNLTGSPWYVPYIEIAQDLSPYLTGRETRGEASFIITAQEALDPNHKVSRYEFVEMSVRVLRAYNCFEQLPEEPEIELDPGIYAVTEECLSCPCAARIEYDSDLLPGDIVFGIIQNEDGEIFEVSNQVTIQE